MNRLLLALVVLVAGGWPGISTALEAGNAGAANKITVYVTVDWEGWTLDDENIEAMREFRQRHPHIPMLQLLNPVYAVRHGADAAQIARKIRSTLLPADTQGLHLHAWKSLMDKCAVPFKSTPAFDLEQQGCAGGDCGYAVSLEDAYSQQELTRLVGCGADLLVAQGFARPRHFRAGGWQQGPKLAAALQANGFTFDSSRTDARLLAAEWGDNSAMVNMVRQHHPDASPLDQPYKLAPGLTEFPNNGSLADYTSPQQLLDIFKLLLANGKSVLVLGFHQETAYNYLSNLERAIPLMEQAAKQAGVSLEWGR